MTTKPKKENGNGKKIYSPIGRVSFPYVFEKNDYNDPAKYELTLLFPPNTDLIELKNAARIAVKEKWGDKIPKGLRSPFRDAGEKEGLDGYEPGWVFVAFRTTRRPGVVDEDVQPIIDPEEFYPGCWARVTCNPYAYNRKGNAGVAFGLNNVQKMKDDENFQGGSKPEDDFEPVTTGGSGEAFVDDNDDIFGDSDEGLDDDIAF